MSNPEVTTTVEQLQRTLDIDLQRVCVHSTFEAFTPLTHIEKWIENAKKDLVLETYLGGRSVVTAPRVDREGFTVYISALSIRVVTP
jgi:hypothetical protein